MTKKITLPRPAGSAYTFETSLGTTKIEMVDGDLALPSSEGSLISILTRTDGFTCRTYRFPADMPWSDLPVKEIAGTSWYPCCGNLTTRENAEQRRKLGDWPEHTMIEGRMVEYRPGRY